MLSGNMYILRAEGARKFFVFTIHYYEKRKVTKFSGMRKIKGCIQSSCSSSATACHTGQPRLVKNVVFECFCFLAAFYSLNGRGNLCLIFV